MISVDVPHENNGTVHCQISRRYINPNVIGRYNKDGFTAIAGSMDDFWIPKGRQVWRGMATAFERFLYLSSVLITFRGHKNVGYVCMGQMEGSPEIFLLRDKGWLV